MTMKSQAQKPSGAVAPVFAELGARGAEVRAAGRDLEKAFVSSVLADYAASKPEEVRSKVRKIAGEEAGTIGVLDPAVIEGAVDAVIFALTPRRDGGVRGDLQSQVQRALARLPVVLAQRIADRVIVELARAVDGTAIDSFTASLFACPSSALGRMVDAKVGKFFTRGVGVAEIRSRSVQELSSSLARALRNCLDA